MKVTKGSLVVIKGDLKAETYMFYEVFLAMLMLLLLLILRLLKFGTYVLAI